MKRFLVAAAITAAVLLTGALTHGKEDPKRLAAAALPSCSFMEGTMIVFSPSDVPELREAFSRLLGYRITLDRPAYMVRFAANHQSGERVPAGRAFEMYRPSDARCVIISDTIPGEINLTLDSSTYVVPVKAVPCRPDAGARRALVRALYNEIAGAGILTNDAELYYRLTVLMARHGGEDREIAVEKQWRRSSRPEIVELFELTSGTLAIEQSLQLNAGRNVSTGKTGDEKTLQVSTLKAPELKTHDFNAMAKGKKISIPDVARMVPHDALFLRFDSIGAALRADDLSNTVKEYAPLFTRHVAVPDDMMQRVLTHLGLKKPNPVTRKFYGLAIGEMSVVLHDPYLLEGADMAFIMEVKSDALFERQIKTYREEFRKKYPRTTQETVTHRGTEITRFASPDGEVRAHSFRNGRFAVIASSLAFAKKIIDTTGGNNRSAADNPDYRYLLGVHDAKADAFLYIGDDFVGRVISAPFKIGELRRVNCEANLKLLRWACNYRLIEKGSSAPVEQLVKEGYLSRIPLCPCGGEYSLEKGVPRCTRHGRLGQLNPLSANEVTLVTEEEARQYRNFTDNYHRFWRTYIDPIGIAADLAGSVKVRTVILPLVENSEYNLLKTIAGGPPSKLQSLSAAPDNTVFHLALKLNPFDGYRSDLSHVADERIRREMARERESMKREFPDFKGDIYGWIGSEVDFFILDLARKSDADRIDLYRGSFETIPFDRFVGRLAVRDFELAREVFITLLPRLELRGTLAKETGLGGPLFEFKIGYKLGAALLLRKDGLWASGSAETLREMFSRGERRQGKVAAKRYGLRGEKGNFETGIYPQAMKNLWGTAEQLFHLAYASRCESEMRRFDAALAIHDPMAWAKESNLSGRKLLKSDDQPVCPLGGTYSYKDGHITCSLHARGRNSLKPDLLARPTPLAAMARRIKFLLARLSFTVEGIDTEVIFKNPAE